MPDVRAAIDVVHRLEVEVRRCDMGDHRLGQPAIDVLADEVPVDQVLHGGPDLGDGERIQLALGCGRRVEHQRQRRGGRLEHLDPRGALQLLGRLRAQPVQIEVDVAGLELEGRGIHEHRLEGDLVCRGSRRGGARRRRRAGRRRHRRGWILGQRDATAQEAEADRQAGQTKGGASHGNGDGAGEPAGCPPPDVSSWRISSSCRARSAFWSRRLPMPYSV